MATARTILKSDTFARIEAGMMAAQAPAGLCSKCGEPNNHATKCHRASWQKNPGLRETAGLEAERLAR